MLFLIPENGKNVIHNGAVLIIEGGKFETEDKVLQSTLVKCTGVTKQTKSKID